MGAVGLHSHHLVNVVEGIDETSGELQRRLTAGDHHQPRRILGHLGCYLIFGHFAAALMLRIAKRALQVAPAQPHKDSGRACMISLSLQTVENLVYFHGSSISYVAVLPVVS